MDEELLLCESPVKCSHNICADLSEPTRNGDLYKR